MQLILCSTFCCEPLEAKNSRVRRTAPTHQSRIYHSWAEFFSPTSTTTQRSSSRMRVIAMFLTALAATAHVNDQIQDHFDAIRACSVNYHCTDDYVPDQCLPGKLRYRSSGACVKRNQAQCHGSSCSRKALIMKKSDFEAILAKFNVALLANKSVEKKRHELFIPGHGGIIDIGLCAGSCLRAHR